MPGRLIYILQFVFLFVTGSADAFQQKTVHSKKADTLQNFYISKATRYLIKHEELWEYLEISKHGIDIFASPEDKKKKIPECRLYWDEIDAFNNIVKSFRYEDAFATYKNKKYNRFDPLLITATIPPKGDLLTPTRALPLLGKKIALDPGHVGNSFKMGVIESRFLEMKHNSQDIKFAEAELTYATAYILKDLLTSKGAEVILTRSDCGVTALGIPFDEWKKDKMPEELNEAVKEGKISKEFANWLKSEATETKVFQKYFQNIDWRERCKIINNFKPDLTIIIHFNADEDNHGWNRPTSKNYNVSFVGGSYVKDELLKIEDRFQFLRQLVSPDIENSIRLSGAVIKNFESTLKVPTISKKDESNNIRNFSIPTAQKGVYARNLALTRYIFGALCYGESLLQDNEKEALLLNKRDLTYPCGKTSSRVSEVAMAYYRGIMNYYNAPLDLPEKSIKLGKN